MHDRVLIKRQESKEMTASGLYIPSGAQEKSNLATVVAVGPGTTNMQTGEKIPCTVEVGQTVLIGKWAGDEVQVEGVDHLLVREADILSIIEEA